jgi:hypothetical protein
VLSLSKEIFDAQARIALFSARLKNGQLETL